MTRRATGDLQFVQQMNRKLVLDTLLRGAPMSRVEIARTTTLSPTTVTNAVSALMEEGLVTEIGAGRSTIGRRPILLDVCWDARSVVGLSVLDNHMVGVRTNLRAEVQEVYHHPMNHASDILRIAKTAATDLLRGQDRSTVLGIGVSTPGILNRHDGVVERTANFPWRELHLGAELSNFTGVPVLLENDTNAAAIGEHHFGCGRGMTSFAYVHIGTGVGAGIVVDGRLLFGTRGNAGEIGHMTVDWQGRSCRCGSRGCLEPYVNWGAIMELASKFADGHPLSSTDVVDRSGYVRQLFHDPSLAKPLRESARIMGVGLASLVAVTDPEMVIIEGIYRECDDYIQQVKASMEERLAYITHQCPVVTCGQLGDHAAVMGAIAIVLQQHGFLQVNLSADQPAVDWSVLP